MDITSAYREVGTYRGAAAISGTTPKTVRRMIARHEVGGGAPVRGPRGHNYDTVTGLVAGRVAKAQGRITAKRLLPAAQAAGYGVGAELPPAGRGAEALWRRENHRGRRPAVWSPGEHLVIDWGRLLRSEQRQLLEGLTAGSGRISDEQVVSLLRDTRRTGTPNA